MTSKPVFSAVLFIVGISVTGCVQLSELVTSEVRLDSNLVERIITEDLLKSGEPIKEVSCPNPLEGQPGDSRQCILKDLNEQSYIVDIMIQNREGYFVWKIRE